MPKFGERYTFLLLDMAHISYDLAKLMQSVKKRTYEILEAASPGDLASRVFDIFIITLIGLNVIAFMLETVEILSTKFYSFFKMFELFSIAVFTVEYALRLWSCTAKKDFEHPIMGRLRFALTPLALVDLMAILPFYIPMILPFDLRFIRALRLFRIFRVLKIARYSEALKIVGNVLKQTKEELLSSLFVMSILLLIVSSLMYIAEHETQPKVFSNVFDAIWWGVVTLTTVGYGDIYPVTPLGKLLGVMVAITGIGIFALPAGILASGFTEEIKKKKIEKETIICPHCGKPIIPHSPNSIDRG